MLFYACALVLLGIGTPSAFAAEIITECPRVSPVDNRTPLAFVSIRHDGENEWGYPDADVERRENGRIYRMNDFEASEFRKARMQCIFAVNRRPPRHSTFLPMPGLLLRCESEGPDTSDYSVMYGRIWCTSRVE
jgi:hypothetical protein